MGHAVSAKTWQAQSNAQARRTSGAVWHWGFSAFKKSATL
jgi:hypothetical protein